MLLGVESLVQNLAELVPGESNVILKEIEEFFRMIVQVVLVQNQKVRGIVFQPIPDTSRIERVPHNVLLASAPTTPCHREIGHTFSQG